MSDSPSPYDTLKRAAQELYDAKRDVERGQDSLARAESNLAAKASAFQKACAAVADAVEVLKNAAGVAP